MAEPTTTFKLWLEIEQITAHDDGQTHYESVDLPVEVGCENTLAEAYDEVARIVDLVAGHPGDIREAAEHTRTRAGVRGLDP